jgi:hypothetical protein
MNTYILRKQGIKKKDQKYKSLSPSPNHYFAAKSLMLVYGQMQAQIKKQHSQTTILRRDLQALIKEVITQPLNYHVTLSWSQWLIINTKNKSLGGFLHSDATRTLKNA